MKKVTGQVLFLKGNGATLYRSSKNGASITENFDLNDASYARFSELVGNAPDITTYILVDVLEEEYHLSTVPHVPSLSPDHKPQLDRQAERVLRGAPLRYWMLQGRETQGRRDDRVLITGITSKDLLKPWLEALERHQVSLGGIISLPLLSQTLMRAIGKMTGSQLLVTKVADNLRLSVFVDGQLKISRITPLRHATSTATAETFIKEVEKTQLYLGRVRLMGPTGKINVRVVGTGMLLELVRCETRDSEAMAWHMIELGDLAKKADVAGSWDTFDCEGLFAQLVLQRARLNHYATPDQLRAKQLRNVDKKLRMAGVSIFTAALGLAAWNVAASLEISDRGNQVDAQTVTHKLAYTTIEQSLPADLTMDTDDLHAVIQATEKLDALKATPKIMLGAISSALDRQPAVVLDRILFKVMTPDVRQLNFAPQADPLAPVNAPEEVDASGRYLVEEIMQLSGRMLDFERDYQGAHVALMKFTDSLRQSGHFSRVTILQEPINTNPLTTLEGSYDVREEAALAQFSLEVVRERRHDP